MKKRFTLALLVGTALSGHAFALDACKPSDDDPLARTCVYQPGQRYVVNGMVGFPVNLNFGPDEHLKRLEPAYTGIDKDGNPAPTWLLPKSAGGQSGQAAVVKKDLYDNNLPIWPMHAGHSFLQVITQTTAGAERPYLFDLWANAPAADCDAKPSGSGCRDDKTTTASLTFAYPADDAAKAKQEADEKKHEAQAAWRANQAKLSEKIALSRLKVDAFYGPQNKDYSAHGDPKYKSLAPSLISDNGFLTEMQWPGNTPIPTVTIVNPVDGKCPVKGDEWSPSITTQGHMQVIHLTAQCFRLHLGKEAVLDVWNNKWSPERPDPETGTTSPDVVRQVIYTGSK